MRPFSITRKGGPGKIEVIPTKPYSTQKDLSLAYSPGVAEPCLAIENDPDDAYKYTAKGNLVAVISNGTAVLGLGDIGAGAGKPVMEGKGLLFKTFADIDVFDIEVDTKDTERFIETVKNISVTFGGINLEDIKAPECFEIEERLKEELSIPVMHDDQHGTAIISSAALLNALEVAGKKIEEVQVVVNGAGAAAVSCARLYIALGVKPEHLVMCDSKGVITTRRQNLSPVKAGFATDRDIETLAEALVGADVFLGLSVADVLTQEMVRSMAANPIVFALANPDPEISYDNAMAAREDIIFATGRSDYPNQVNNVLGFPYIFRGALDVRATKINEAMKIGAVLALAELAKQPVPDIVAAAYNDNNITFGRRYLIPKALDPRLISCISVAVAKAAIESGVARKTITDWNAYAQELESRMGRDDKLMRAVLSKVCTSAPRRIVFSEGNRLTTIKAAVHLANENIAEPILVGNRRENRASALRKPPESRQQAHRRFPARRRGGTPEPLCRTALRQSQPQGRTYARSDRLHDAPRLVHADDGGGRRRRHVDSGVHPPLQRGARACPSDLHAGRDDAGHDGNRDDEEGADVFRRHGRQSESVGR